MAIKVYFYPWWRRVWRALRTREYVKYCENHSCGCSYPKGRP